MLSSLFFYTNKPMIIILTDRVTFVYVGKKCTQNELNVHLRF